MSTKKKCHEQLSLFPWGLQGRERESADTEPNTFYAYYIQPQSKSQLILREKIVKYEN